jgi:hypothetical protein
MVWLPAARVLMVKVAMPPLRVPVPRVVLPSEKVTVPVGVPPALVTTAVKVTDWPNTEGLAEEVTVVVVLALFTCWVTLPLLVAKELSPL